MDCEDLLDAFRHLDEPQNEQVKKTFILLTEGYKQEDMPDQLHTTLGSVRNYVRDIKRILRLNSSETIGRRVLDCYREYLELSPVDAANAGDMSASATETAQPEQAPHENQAQANNDSRHENSLPRQTNRPRRERSRVPIFAGAGAIGLLAVVCLLAIVIIFVVNGLRQSDGSDELAEEESEGESNGSQEAIDQGQTPEPTEVPPLFFDDFSEGTGQWNRESGNVSIVDGQLVFNEASRITAGDPSWTNYRLTFEVQGMSCQRGVRSTGLTTFVRYQDSANYVKYVAHAVDYCGGRWFMNLNGRETGIADSGTGLWDPIDGYRFFEFTIDGNTYSVEHGKSITLDDDGLPLSGGIAIGAARGIRIDNVRVVALDD